MRYLKVLSIILFIVGCNEKTPVGKDSELQITNITANPVTISVGSASTVIVATNTTEELTYKWSADLGYVIGSGNEIRYSASSCCVGKRTVTCTVQSEDGSEASKSVHVTVNP